MRVVPYHPQRKDSSECGIFAIGHRTEAEGINAYTYTLYRADWMDWRPAERSERASGPNRVPCEREGCVAQS